MTSNDPSGRRTVLITGASLGIGRDLAELFAKDNFDLVLVARGLADLQTVADDLSRRFGVVAQVIAMDLSAAAAAVQLYEQVRQRGAPIDVLVNNAGFGAYGPFAESDLNIQLQMIGLNISALTQLTHLVLPDMLKRRSGRIMNVASTAAFQPGPLMAVYYATKAYVLSFSEAIANELEGTGVSVTALCPGVTATGFQLRARLENSRLVTGLLMDSATVARIGYQGMLQGKSLVIPGFRYRLLTLAPRFLPRRLVARIVRKAQEPMTARRAGKSS